MAEIVVVLLEAVEIEEPQHQLPLRGRLRDPRLEVVDQRPAVAEPRERIGERLLAAGAEQVRVLTLEPLRAPVEEAEGAEQQQDRRRRARQGLIARPHRALVVFGACGVEQCGDLADRLPGHRRELVGLAVVADRDPELIDLADGPIVGSQRLGDLLQLRRRRVLPQIGERLVHGPLVESDHLARMGRVAAGLGAGLKRRALQARERGLHLREAELGVVGGAGVLLKQRDHGDRGEREREGECGDQLRAHQRQVSLSGQD